MQKRDKSGRFLKKKSVKKAKKVKKPKVKKEKPNLIYKSCGKAYTNEFLWDIQDMISEEVERQLKDW